MKASKSKEENDPRIRAFLDALAEAISESILKAIEQKMTAREPEEPPRQSVVQAMHYLRLREVEELTGRSRSSIYRDEADGTFPMRRRLGARSVAWRSDEIEEWIQTRRRP